MLDQRFRINAECWFRGCGADGQTLGAGVQCQCRQKTDSPSGEQTGNLAKAPKRWSWRVSFVLGGTFPYNKIADLKQGGDGACL